MEEIKRYTKDMDFEDFIKNEVVIDAVIRNLEIIGEAVRTIPEDLRLKYKDVPWKKIVRFRNIVILWLFWC